MKRFLSTLLALLALSACGKKTDENTSAPMEEKVGETSPAETASPTPAPPQEEAKPSEPAPAPPATSSKTPTSASAVPSETGPKEIFWNAELLHAGLKHHNPSYTGQGQFHIEEGKVLAAVLPGMGISDLSEFPTAHLRQVDLSENPIKDISQLKGAPLEIFYAEKTMIEDLTPLRGAKLQALSLSQTPVHDISPLSEAQLTEIRLVETRVADISVLEGMPIQAAWFTGSPVNSIAALSKSPLVTLTLQKTKITDVSPLASTQIQRLHIGETPVRDLRPLAGLPLTRLVFTPPFIAAGMEEVRALPLREIGTKFDDEGKDLVAPSRFWPAWDAVMAAQRQQIQENQTKPPTPAPAE